MRLLGHKYAESYKAGKALGKIGGIACQRQIRKLGLITLEHTLCVLNTYQITIGTFMYWVAAKHCLKLRLLILVLIGKIYRGSCSSTDRALGYEPRG